MFRKFLKSIPGMLLHAIGRFALKILMQEFLSNFENELIV